MQLWDTVKARFLPRRNFETRAKMGPMVHCAWTVLKNNDTSVELMSDISSSNGFLFNFCALETLQLHKGRTEYKAGPMS
jgi:hypothetical protein